MRSATFPPAARASRIRTRTSGSTLRRFPNASRYSVSKPHKAARSKMRSMDFLPVDSTLHAAQKYASPRSSNNRGDPGLFRYFYGTLQDFTFFGVTRLQTRLRNQSGPVQVPSTPFRRPGGSTGRQAQ